MKLKLKNSVTDVVVIIGYHLLALGLTLCVLIYISYGELVFDSRVFTKIMHSKTSASKEVKSNSIIIELVKGSVQIVEVGESPRVAKTGDTVHEGAIIETGSNSTARIKFGEAYECTLRIGANSKVNIDSLMNVDSAIKKESTLFNLIKGAVFLVLKNDEKKAEIKVKTFAAVFAVRGTKFSVVTDGAEHSVLNVQEGIVDAENFFNSRIVSVEKNLTYIVNKSGFEKIESSTDSNKEMNWDLTEDLPQIDISKIVTIVGEPVDTKPHPAEAAPGGTDLATTIGQELSSFKKDSEEIVEVVKADKESLAKNKAELEEEKKSIASDIHCIESSSSPCKLFAEKILLKRGFMITHGSPRLRQSMVEDLKKYLVERKSEVEDMDLRIKKNEEIIKLREETLKWAEDSLQNKLELDKIIPKLNDKKLQRY